MNRISLLLPAAFLLAPASSAQCEIARVDPNAPVNLNAGAVLTRDHLFLPASSGDVILYARDPDIGWLEDRTIDMLPGALFYDDAIASREDCIVQGAPDAGPEITGEVRVYERERDWAPVTLSATGLQGYELFGSAVAISGDTLVATATMDHFMFGTGPGKAYVFERAAGGWEETARLAPAGPTAEPRFGASAATDGDTVVIGATLDGHGGKDAGAVYVYERGSMGWAPVAKLLAAVPTPGAEFGTTIAVDGEHLLVSDLQDRVFAFRRTGGQWTATQALTASDGVAGDSFGLALDLDGDRAAIGAPLAAGSAPASGKVYVFRHDGAAWIEEWLAAPDDLPQNYYLGRSVSLWGNQVLAGPAAGPQARLYSLGFEETSDYCPAGINSTGFAATLAAEGCDSVVADEVTLRAEHVPPGELGVLLFSLLEDQVPFGNGALCLGPPFGRAWTGAADASGVVQAPLDLDHAPADAITAGETWRFQLLFRDPGVGAGFDSSDALRIQFRP